MEEKVPQYNSAVGPIKIQTLKNPTVEQTALGTPIRKDETQYQLNTKTQSGIPGPLLPD